MNSTLRKITIELNKANILWGLGGSAMLGAYHLVDVVNDIDILIAEHDIKQAENILSAFAVKGMSITKEPFATKHFHTYTYNNTSIDVMAGFQIYHEAAGLYKLAFDRQTLTANMHIDDNFIPLSSLEDWYILYALIPGRNYKADLIETYWKAHGIQNPYLITRALKRSLPGPLRHKLEHLLRQ